MSITCLCSLVFSTGALADTIHLEVSPPNPQRGELFSVVANGEASSTSDTIRIASPISGERCPQPYPGFATELKWQRPLGDDEAATTPTYRHSFVYIEDPTSATICGYLTRFIENKETFTGEEVTLASTELQVVYGPSKAEVEAAEAAKPKPSATTQPAATTPPEPSTGNAVLATPLRDSLRKYGSSTVHVPYSRIYAFSASYAALPCHIKLTERAAAGGRHVGGLDRTSGPVITMHEEPREGEPYAVWFQRGDLNQNLLDRTLKRYGAVVLQISATLTDAAGKRISARRPITIRPASPRPRAKPHAPSPPPSQTQRAVQATIRTLKERKAVFHVDEVNCTRLTQTRYRCTFSYYSTDDSFYGCLDEHGYSDVNFLSYGVEVNLHVEPNTCVERAKERNRH